MPSVKRLFIVKLHLSYQRTAVIALVLLAIAALIVAILGNRDQGNVVATPPVRIVESVEAIWPDVKSKTLMNRQNEYRPSTNPREVDAFCVHQYSDDTNVYQYIGQTDSLNPKLSCS